MNVTTQMNVPPHQRIDAIDFWRGFALLSIFVNHLSDNVFAHITHRNFGFSDAAELFVFLSGMSVALAYGRRFLDGQVGRALGGIYRRVASLYVVQVIVSIVGIAILVAAADLLDDEDFVEDPDRESVVEDPMRSVVAIFALMHQFSFFNILPLYIAVLVVTPALLLLARTDKRLMLVASAAVYLATRIFSLHLPTWPLAGEWYFNPFAWQLLFVLGLYIGLRLNEKPKFHAGLFALSVAAVIASAFIVTDGFSFFPGLWNGIRGGIDHDKTGLSWVRLAHFIALAYAVYYSGLTDLLRGTRIYAPLCLIGRHSLPVFAAGAILLVVGEVLMDVDIPEQITGFLIAVGGILAHYLVARVFEARAIARKGALASASQPDRAAGDAPPYRAQETKAAASSKIEPALSSMPRG